MKFLSPLSSLVIILLAPIAAFPSDLYTLLETDSCIKCDLSFADLNYSKFMDGDLSGSDLSYMNASRSSFFRYSFRSATLSHANFRYARLISSDFTDVVFDDAIFDKTVVTNSIFDYQTVPSYIIINSIDFPVHKLSNERVYNLLSIASPETHPEFYLSLLKHIQSTNPNDPNITFLLAHFFFKHQSDYSSSILYLDNAASQYKSLGQIKKSEAVSDIATSLRLETQRESSFNPPNFKGNGLGISGVNSVGKFFSGLLPALTTLGRTLIR